MPNGKYDSNLRKARYARLRDIGVPRNLAMLVRDWSPVSYNIFLVKVKKYGLAHVLSEIPS